jgi:hypothetical protein
MQRSDPPTILWAAIETTLNYYNYKHIILVAHCFFRQMVDIETDRPLSRYGGDRIDLIGPI